MKSKKDLLEKFRELALSTDKMYRLRGGDSPPPDGGDPGSEEGK